MTYPPTASGKDLFPTLTSIQSSKIWLGNQEAFSGDYWIMEKEIECYQKTVGPLCARDYKGIGNEYVMEDKLIMEKKDG